MTDPKPINIAIAGLGFGAEFIPIYQRHPGANLAAICQRTQAKLDEVGDQYGIDKRYTDFADLLADPDIDAVHINTPHPGPRRTSNRGLKSWEKRRLHGADGDYRRGVSGDRRTDPIYRA